MRGKGSEREKGSDCGSDSAVAAAIGSRQMGAEGSSDWRADHRFAQKWQAALERKREIQARSFVAFKLTACFLTGFEKRPVAATEGGDV